MKVQPKDMREIKKIIVHTSDSPDKMDIGVEEIRRWHKERGWSDVGYHYVIRRDGIVEKGRNIIRPGAHTVGHNHDSIGVCWVGRDKPAFKQYKALIKLLGTLCKVFDLRHNEVYGHKDFDSNKTCPNLNVIALQDKVEKWLAAHRHQTVILK